MLAQAARACRAQDYKSLFNAMISSPAARDKYAARQIAYEEMNAQVTGKKSWIPKESYDKFPIKMFDFYRKPTVPAKAGDEDEYVMVEFNQSQSNRISVEWTRVHFRGQPGEGDDLGKPFDLDGEPYDPGRGRWPVAPLSDQGLLGDRLGHPLRHALIGKANREIAFGDIAVVPPDATESD